MNNSSHRTEFVSRSSAEFLNGLVRPLIEIYLLQAIEKQTRGQPHHHLLVALSLQSDASTSVGSVGSGGITMTGELVSRKDVRRPL